MFSTLDLDGECARLLGAAEKTLLTSTASESKVNLADAWLQRLALLTGDGGSGGVNCVKKTQKIIRNGHAALLLFSVESGDFRYLRAATEN